LLHCYYTVVTLLLHQLFQIALVKFVKEALALLLDSTTVHIVCVCVCVCVAALSLLLDSTTVELTFVEIF
jgi:uncharacterized YccA/Bax inhibitor family protein